MGTRQAFLDADQNHSYPREDNSQKPSLSPATAALIVGGVQVLSGLFSRRYSPIPLTPISRTGTTVLRNHLTSRPIRSSARLGRW